MVPILTDNLHRIAYATDASAYRELPMGVAYPECGDDVADLIRYAKEHHSCLIPRAGGTSIAGQVVGNGIVVDVSKHLNRILEINAEERWARVEPGVVRDELNLALKPYGLFFSPETSTSNRCCIGGMVGNNSCGTHSLVYGSTRHHVLQLKGYLSDGSFFDTARVSDASDGLLSAVVGQLRSWQGDGLVRRLVAEHFPDPSLRRRSCGYAIDEAIENECVDLCKLICGSEGTLCFLTEIKVSLDPLPPAENMVLCAHCGSLESSFEANLIALRHNPVAVELMDGKILELCKGNPAAQKNRFFVEGDPAALLVSEFCGREMDTQADALERALLSSGLAYSCTRVYGAEVSRVWALRKAGLGVLSGMKGDAKPIGVIEDTAVAPERLPAYMADFRDMMRRIGLDCVYYGHISTGELHLRPIINIKTEEGRRKFREVAEETAWLVRKHKGSLSGEHGDGRLRGEFIPMLYGEECYQMMRQVKRCWDPDGVFNVGKIVDTPKMDEWLRFQVGRPYAVEGVFRDTYFNWKAAFDECNVEGASGVRSQTHALMCSIEQCNGAGDCRKSNLMGGTLCPAFKVSERDELQATRARANVLREILTNGLDGSVLESAELKEVLNACLACKGCKGECPSNVDMTRIRAEVLQQIYDKEGTPFRSWMVARMALVERLGAIVPPLYNFAATWKPSATLIKKLVGFAPQRSIPTISNPSLTESKPSTLNSQPFSTDSKLSTLNSQPFSTDTKLSTLNSQPFSTDSKLSTLNSQPFSTDSKLSTLNSQPFSTDSKLSTLNSQPFSTDSKLSTLNSQPFPPTVFFFLDEFTRHQEPELAETLVRLLERLGYRVLIPELGECGRAAISKGCLKLAKKYAVRNVNSVKDLVSDETPLIGLEPSCILSFRDEYPDLVPAQLRHAAMQLAKNCLLYDEFFMREVAKGRISSEMFRTDECDIWLHGHCHQKALVGIEKTAAMLRLLKGAKVHVIPSGCCGMAGSFGYEKEHYKTSLAIGEMVLFPAVRNAMADATTKVAPTFIAAPGTSCRRQILDGTGFKAVHPIVMMSRMLKV